jgi:hypothetical protein
MARGGARPGSGRKPGSANRKTKEIAEGIVATGMSPLEYMVAVMRSTDPMIGSNMKLDAAKAAAPYIHPRLNAIEHSGPDGGPLKVILNGTDADL